MTQSQQIRILNHINCTGKIDRLTAFLELGIFELSARICDLERQGYSFIKTRKSGTSRLGYSFTYVEYALNKGDSNAI